MDMQSVSIIGMGRVGGALALALSSAGYNVENLVYRSTDTAAEAIACRITPLPQVLVFDDLQHLNSEIIFITSADPEIQAISARLTTVVPQNTFVFHTSGSLSSEILSELTAIGCETGSIHPLISISNSFLGSERFAGSFFCVEGSADAVAVAKSLVRKLQGSSFSIETKFKSLYHASAVTASGHLVALIDTAIDMLSKCGLESATAKQILMPLIKSTIENLDEQTSVQALTGTFARADIAAFDRHLASFEDNISNQTRRIYLELGDRSLDIAERRGGSADNAEKIRNAISMAKRISK